MQQSHQTPQCRKENAKATTMSLLKQVTHTLKSVPKPNKQLRQPRNITSASHTPEKALSTDKKGHNRSCSKLIVLDALGISLLGQGDRKFSDRLTCTFDISHKTHTRKLRGLSPPKCTWAQFHRPSVELRVCILMCEVLRHEGALASH